MTRQITNENVRKNARGDYAVGYGKPPPDTRFRKGQSGNRSGRPPGTSLGRTKALALEEAYRTVTVKEGRDTVALPAIQAILRRQIALATKGNGPAQRAVIAAVLGIEEEQARVAAEYSARKAAADNPADLIDAARRICFLLRLSAEEQRKIMGEGVPLFDIEASAPDARALSSGAETDAAFRTPE
jgi:hypothetical protein